MSRPAHLAAVRRPLVAAVGLVLVVGGLLHLTAGYSGGDGLSVQARGHDDAYISFRYAENLAGGYGLVYNPGERVEGYSNLLLVLAEARVATTLGREALYPAVALASLAAALGLWWGTLVWTGRRLGPEAALATALLLALWPSLWAATATGLETVTVLALQVALWLTAESAVERRDGRGAALLALWTALLGLVRVDGLLLPLLVACYCLARRRWRLATGIGCAAGTTAALLTGWRLAYYGAWLPNTFYAKVSGPLGERLALAGEQLAGLAAAQGLLPYLLVLGAAAVAALRGRASEPRLAPGLAPLLGLGLAAYWLWVGGDSLGERLLLPLAPLGALTLLAALERLRAPAVARWVLVAALALWQLSPLLHDGRFAYDRHRQDAWLELGVFLGDRHPGALLAAGAAGKVPWASGLTTLDMRGLTDAHVARVPVERFREPGHNKQDPLYVLRRRPHLIAGWVRPSLHLVTGLDRSLYREHGYRVRYLVDVRRGRRSGRILDVEGWPRWRKRRAVLDGRGFAVLALQSPPVASSTPADDTDR